MNHATLIGRLGKDPEVRFTQGGTAVCNFSMATSESWTGADGQRQERTDWHNIVVWGKMGEACGNHLSKGSQVAVTGRIQTRKYQDRQQQDRYVTEIVAARVEFLGSRDGGQGNAGQEGNTGQRPAEPRPEYQSPPTDDDIPF